MRWPVTSVDTSVGNVDNIIEVSFIMTLLNFSLEKGIQIDVGFDRISFRMLRFI